MKRLLKSVLWLPLLIPIAYLFAWATGSFLAKQVSINEELVVENYNRSFPPYNYGNKNSDDSNTPEYIFGAHGFAVRFPEKPKTSNYGEIVQYEFGAETEKTATYNILVSTYEKPLLTNEVIKAHLEGFVRGREKTFGNTGKMTSLKEVLFLGHRAVDYEYTKDINGFKSYFKGVHFVVENIAYTISVVCIEETKTSSYQQYDKLVRSFRLTKNTENKYK